MTDPLSRRGAVSRMATAAGALAVPSLAGATPRAREVVEPMSDADIERLLRLASVPAVCAAVIDRGKTTFRALGFRRAGEAERVTPGTVFSAASLSKPMFAYAFHSLVLDGKLSLDQPLREVLPLPNPDDAQAAAITARHLLSHSGGWRNWRNNATQPLTADFVPGSRWSYSGEGFFFLQRVAEKLTGKSVGTLMHERVFDPLGMTRSSFLLTEAQEPYAATGHDARGNVVQPFGRPTLLELRKVLAARGAQGDTPTVADSEQAMRSAEPTLPVLPNFLQGNVAGGMQTSIEDYAKFLSHLVNARAAGGRPAAIVQQMWTPQVRCNESVQWGLGLGLEDIGTQRNGWQWGDNPGFKHVFFADAQNGRAIAVFTNGDRGARVYERVVRAEQGHDHPAFLWA